MISVAAAGIADPSRFRRAKGYVTDKAVIRLEVDTGIIRAIVAGSRDPYLVSITVATVAPPTDGDPTSYRGDVTRIAPDGSELRFTCTCPDDANPCKHGLATLLAFSDEVVQRPELLIAWRCQAGAPMTRRPGADVDPTGSGRRPPRSEGRVGSPSGSTARPVPEPRPSPLDPYRTAEWLAFAGSTDDIPPAPQPAGAASALKPSAIDVTGAEELLAAMHDALRHVRWR